MKIGIKEKYVLIIDEFQEFFKINSSVYSSIQELYDQYRYDSKVCILFLGSVNCLMNKIFLS